MYGDTKIVINSITYDNYSNNILVGVRKNQETEDSQTAEVVLDNAGKRFTNLNLRGLTAIISYDEGSGLTAIPTLTVVTQDDITSGGNYQTVLSLVGIPDLLAEDKASKEYIHNPTDIKTVKDLLTEVLDGTAVASTVTAEQATTDSYFNMYEGSIILVGQFLHIKERTVSSIQFYLKKTGSPTGDIIFYMRPTDESWLETKVLGDASTLTTSGVWYEATLDTPRAVDEDVTIYCYFPDGDSSNYVQVGYNSTSVVSGEYLGLRYASGEWNLYEALDCGYKYSYSEAGVDCFAHTTSYTATFDSESSLMDTYQPKGDFTIDEGESRLDVVNRLLDYVSDFKRIESDDQPHFFTIPTSGNSYTSDKGEFYSHSNRKALVIPNKQVVKSVDFETDGYTGSATSAASYALLPISGSPIRAYVSGSSQAQDVAEAVIVRLEVNAQVGSSNVPMNNYEQIWNYVTVNNTWNGSTTTGNIAYLNRVSMNGRFYQFFSFGRQGRKGIAGMSPKREVKLEQAQRDDTTLKWGMIRGLFEIIDENTDDIYERLNIIFEILENMGVKVDAMNSDLSDNIDNLLDEKVETLKLYIAGVVERWHVTKELIIPVTYTIPES